MARTFRTPFRTLACLVLLAGSAILVASNSAAQSEGAKPENTETGSGVLQQIDSFIASQDIDRTDARWRQRPPKPPKLEFEKGQTIFWDLETSEGSLTIKLMPGVAPMHVSSTLYLTQLGFYDGTLFHRVIKGFMAQGGDPRGTGTGGPGYTYAGEFDANVRHTKPGLLSMANAGPGTDGSQFFLTFEPTAWLDGKHTIFGEIVDGQETLEKLESHGSSSGKPRKELRLEKASIRLE